MIAAVAVVVVSNSSARLRLSSKKSALRDHLTSVALQDPPGTRSGTNGPIRTQLEGSGFMQTVRTQARGRVRRSQLLDAARTLLDECQLDEISLGDVARTAGVPKASAYHFYTNVQDLYSELVRTLGQELADVIAAPISERPQNWPEVISICLRRGVAYLTGNGASRQLILGPKSPAEIKRADRQNDYVLGRIIQKQVNRFFELPEIPNRDQVFYFAIELADVLFCLSILHHGVLKEEIYEEGEKAALAYLGLYFPPILPRRVRPLAETNDRETLVEAPSTLGK